MINMYAFTYPSAVAKYLKDGFILAKVGDSIRDVNVRMREQGGSAEYEEKINIFSWNDLKNIKRDYQVHRVLTKRGLHNQEGLGTEWFKIPATTIEEVKDYLDDIITGFENRKVRRNVKLRALQERKLNQAMDIIDKCSGDASILANLCPRFGKTIWALSLFNRVSEKYGNRVMLLPAYWLSVHSSFINELDEYAEFTDIAEIDVNDPNAEQLAKEYLEQGMRIVVPMSLHGDLTEWQTKHQWLSEIANNDIFMFADEGDFGTHTENQVAKLKYIFDHGATKDIGKFVSVYASGTNVQRLAKCSKHIDGVLYTAYSQLEQTEPGIISRKFYCLEVSTLKQQVEALGHEVQSSWIKLNSKPLANKAFFEQLGLSLFGYDSLRRELNLSAMADEPVYCAMLLTSADKKGMKQIGEIMQHSMPEIHVKVLNGDYTTNKNAENETVREINEAKIAGKKGVLIIANQMGSRSYSIPEIQATIIAFDRGSVDATTQKVSRCLTPGVKYDGESKEFGMIVDLSFDPNRAENIERLVLEEAIQVQRDSEDASDFTQAVKYVLSSVDMFKMNEYGLPVEVTEEDLFKIFGDNETMLKVADVSVDITAAIESGMFDVLSAVTGGGKESAKKKDILGEGVKNSVKVGGNSVNTLTDTEKRNIEDIINNAIRSLNMSATTVYFLANGAGESYRDCLEKVAVTEDEEFIEFYGVSAKKVISLLDNKILNEAILDVVVQNSKPKEIDNLFI
jgi:hypothetical protein